MLKIWGRNNSINVQKVMWTVAELGLAHERIDVGGAFGGLREPAYNAMNPNQRIPVLEDGDTVIWESNVIVRYLAARYGAGNLWPEDPAGRALSDQWMEWMVTTIVPDLIPVFLALIRTPPEQRDDAAIEAGVKRLGSTFQILDRQLAERSFVTGESLTMGDIPLGAACYRYHELPIDRPELPNVARWYERLRNREAYRTHVMLPVT